MHLPRKPPRRLPDLPIISVRNLFYTYDDGTEALRNINLDIPTRELFVLFGPSRAGKTTLLRLFNRLSDLSENATHQGEVLVDDRDIFDPVYQCL